jgi:hypothetical protein
MTESNFQSVSGIPMMVIIAFLLVYGGLFVLFQVEIGISMFVGFLAAIIVYVFKYTSLLQPYGKEEEE